jgi:hypothetical protein
MSVIICKHAHHRRCLVFGTFCGISWLIVLICYTGAAQKLIPACITRVASGVYHVEFTPTEIGKIRLDHLHLQENLVTSPIMKI